MKQRENIFRRIALRFLPAAIVFSLLTPETAFAASAESAAFIERPNNVSAIGRWTGGTTFNEIGEGDFVGRSTETSASFLERAGQAGQRPLPSRITDLTVTATSSSTVSLQWTAPFADHERSTGTVVKYIIRHSITGEIATDAAFRNTTDYANAFIPKNPGETETRSLANLTANTIHAISVEAVNEYGVRNERAASSSATTTSPPAPADPDLERFLDVDLAPNGSLYAVGQSSQSSANLDILIARYDTSFNLVSSKTINGTAGMGNDAATAVAVSSDNLVFVLARISRPGNVIRSWLASYDASLNLISSMTFNQSAVIDVGHLSFTDTQELLLAGNVASGSDTDVWVAKYSKAMALISSATFNTGLSPSLASGSGAALDSVGNVYVSGSVPPSAGAPTDIWIGKFNANLVYLASATRAGTGGTADMGLAVAVSPNSDVFLGGNIDNGGPNLQAWLARYDTNLALKQEITVDGGTSAGTDFVWDMEIGNGGNIVLAGSLDKASGADNIWHAEYNRVLVLQSSAAFNGGAGTDKAFGVSVDTTNNTAYISGTLETTNEDVYISSFSIAAPPSACSDLTSLQNGPWSLVSTWFPPFVPSACNKVTVSAGTTVTVDITTAAVSTLTVQGILYASRVADSSLTIVSGDLTVSPGGHLNYGAPGDAIPSSWRSHLILAPGSTAGEFGLIVQNGGDFTAKGSTKSPWGYALGDIAAGGTSLTIAASSATGWAVGDRVLISPTDGSGTSSAEERTLSAVTGANPLTLTWSGGLSSARSAVSSTPIIVANISRNVLIRSSGTNTSTNSAYIRNLAANASSFFVADAELAYLGANAASKYGLIFDGTSVQGSISSSTLRHGYRGVYFNGASTNTLTSNLIYANAEAGVYLDNGASNNAFWKNNLAANGAYGVRIRANANQNNLVLNNAFSNQNAGAFLDSASHWTTLKANRLFSNGVQGLWISGTNAHTITGNSFYKNSAAGMQLDASSRDNLVEGNESFQNGTYGFLIAGDDHRLGADRAYANGSPGLLWNGAQNGVFADGALGYDSAGTAKPNGTRQMDFADADFHTITLKSARLEPTGGLNTDDFNGAGEFLLSYNQDYATGTARFYGDHTISGSTWTFAYTQRIYASTATRPKAMSGPLHNLTINLAYDADAVTQLITFTFKADSLWHVDGSSSGPDMFTFTGIQDDVDVPAVSPQFQMDFANVVTPNFGDRMDFLLIGAGSDANTQKKLLFGPVNSSLNSGRSRLQVAANGGMLLAGTAAAPTVMDRLNSSSTYYSFSSSGAFTARLSSMTNMDANGIHLMGSAGVEISTSAFDFIGITAATVSYITAQDLTSRATFYSNTFGLSRSVTGVPNAYNIRIAGSDTGLEWLFFQSTGSYQGESVDFDPGGRVNWTDGAGQPGTPSGVVLGVSSIAWTWGASMDAATYNVYRASDGVTIVSAPASPTFNDVGLDTNTAYGIFVEPLHGLLGAGPLSAKATVYTLAVPPAGSAASQIAGSSATITWSLNTNPAGTFAQIERSTDNAVFTAIASGPVTSYTDFGLLGCSTYYFRVRNLNGDFVPTAYDGTVQLLTNGSTPTAPGGFTAETLTGNRIALNWTLSSSSQSAGYRLYYDAGSGIVNYASPFAVFNASVTSYVTPVLTSSAAYTFGLRTNNTCGVEEKNLSVTAIAASEASITGVRAAVRDPLSGKKVTGNRLTVSADLTFGSEIETKQVTFQYKNSTDTVWFNIPAADTANPNPDTAPPYAVHWDVTALPTTSFHLRAVAENSAAIPDSAPPASTVFVDHTDWEVNETSIAGSRVRKRQIINNGALNSLRAVDESKQQTTLLAIPAGALSESTVTVTVINNPTTTPAAPADAAPIGASVEITLSNGQSQFSNNQTASLSLSYPDTDGNGFVDGTAVRATELKLFVYDTASGQWQLQFGSTVDAASKTVTGFTPHFSIFGLFAPQHSNLSSILVYPIPYRPNNSDLDDGRHFTPGDPNSGIVFDLLPDNTTIEIYTVAGQLVKEITGVANGRIQWNVRNKDGRDVASGGYIAVIKSDGQQALVRKLLIVR